MQSYGGFHKTLYDIHNWTCMNLDFVSWYDDRMLSTDNLRISLNVEWFRISKILQISWMICRSFEIYHAKFSIPKISFQSNNILNNFHAPNTKNIAYKYASLWKILIAFVRMRVKLILCQQSQSSKNSFNLNISTKIQNKTASDFRKGINI